MTLKEKISSLIFAGFKGGDFSGIQRLIAKYPVGGVIFFKRNIRAPKELKELIEKIKKFSYEKWGKIPFIAVDQEGGRVSRLESPFSILPSNAEIGKHKSKELAYLKSRLIGLELYAVGFNLDFYPVLDLHTNPKNRVIGDRAFGSDPMLVSMLGEESVKGLHSAGVLAVGKHFPGHGDTTEDSHMELPVISRPLEELLKREIIPFERAIEAGVDAIMPAHIVNKEIDDNLIPATFSNKILSGLLRKQLSFRGIIISDDLEMKAISDNYSIYDSVVFSVKAGVDMLLICHSFEKQLEAIESLEKAVKNGELEESRIDASLKRIEKIKEKEAKFPKPQFPDADIEEILNMPEFDSIRQRIATLLES